MKIEPTAREKPILFSGPMVRAILEGRKTMTRRVAKLPQGGTWEPTTVGGERCFRSNGDPAPEQVAIWRPRTGQVIATPYDVGDLLWVRETWAYRYNDDHQPVHPAEILYAATDSWEGRRCSSTHMPRWASRITLEVTDVWVQRLKDITEDEARAEGCLPQVIDGFVECGTRKTTFAAIWDSLNGKRAPWASNPFVWAISFKRITQESAAIAEVQL